MATEESLKKLEQTSREHLGAGVGLGALSLGAAAIGAVCPMCVVAVPALIGSGLWHRMSAQKQRDRMAREAAAQGAPQQGPGVSGLGTDGTP